MGIARIEPLASVIRFWDRSDAVFGDPYDWVATLRWIDVATVEIVGITKPPTPAVWRAVKSACRASGVTKIVFHRIKGGKKIRRELRLTDG